MLHIDRLNAGYGGPPVIQDLALDLDGGEILAVVGRNGSGKSTLVKALIGLLPQIDGTIELAGRPLGRQPSHRIARRGVAYVPQGRGIFPRLTVRENLQTGTRAAGRGARIPDEVFDYFPILAERLGQHGGTMSGGEQQMLAIARALCGRPRLLLMDEPSDGVQPSILDMLSDLIPRIVRERGLALILVEQNLDFALSIAGRCLVMEKGAIVFAGSPDKLRDPAVVTQFLAI